MQHEAHDRGPWNAEAPVSHGYAKCEVDKPHLRRQINEIYRIASGTAEAARQDRVRVARERLA